MITQDNRDNINEDFFEKKIKALQKILEEPEKTPPKEQHSQDSPETLLSEKKSCNSHIEPTLSHSNPPRPIISISGNNNIVSTGESKIIVLKEEKALSWKLILVSCLFF